MVNKAQKALQAGVQWFMIINVQQTMLLCDHGRRVSARHRLHLRQLQRSVQHRLHHILPINSMGYHYGSAEHQASGIRLVLLHVHADGRTGRAGSRQTEDDSGAVRRVDANSLMRRDGIVNGIVVLELVHSDHIHSLHVD